MAADNSLDLPLPELMVRVKIARLWIVFVLLAEIYGVMHAEGTGAQTMKVLFLPRIRHGTHEGIVFTPGPTRQTVKVLFLPRNCGTNVVSSCDPQ